MRLQSELYNLTVPGGPRYAGSRVRVECGVECGQEMLQHRATRGVGGFLSMCFGSRGLRLHALLNAPALEPPNAFVAPHRYYPSKVRRKALAALDAAFPIGSRSRLFVSLLFRLMHPSELPGLLWLAVTAWLQEATTTMLSCAHRACAAVHALLSLTLFAFLSRRHSA